MGLFSKSEEKKKKEFLTACQKGKKKVVLKYCESEEALSAMPVLKGLHLACQYGAMEIVQMLTMMSTQAEAKPRRSVSSRSLKRKGSKAGVNDDGGSGSDGDGDGNESDDSTHAKDGEAVDLINSPSPDGSIALHFAAGYCQLQVAELLLQRGGDVNHKNVHGNTPLHKAAWVGDSKMCDLLIDNGARVNAKNKNRSTPLHRAAGRGYVECCKTLLRKRADLLAVNEAGDTPVSTARKEKKKKVVKLLVEMQRRLANEAPAEGVDADVFSTDDKAKIKKSQSAGNFLVYGSFEAAGDDDLLDDGDGELGDAVAFDGPGTGAGPAVPPRSPRRGAADEDEDDGGGGGGGKRDIARSAPVVPPKRKPKSYAQQERDSAGGERGQSAAAQRAAHAKRHPGAGLADMSEMAAEAEKRRLRKEKAAADERERRAAAAAAQHERSAADKESRAAEAARKRKEAKEAKERREAEKAKYAAATITTTGATAALLAAAAAEESEDSSDEELEREISAQARAKAGENEVTELLRSIGIEEYVATFADEGVETIADLNLLTELNLKELGLKIGARNKLLATRNARMLAGVKREDILKRTSDGKVKDREEAKRKRLEKERAEKEAQAARAARVQASAAGKGERQWGGSGGAGGKEKRGSVNSRLAKAKSSPAVQRRSKKIAAASAKAAVAADKGADSSSSDSAQGDGIEEAAVVGGGGDSDSDDEDMEEVMARIAEMDSLVAKLKRENAAYKEQLSDAPHEFTCPITLEIMTEPVVLSDGFSYERAAIEIWFKSHDSSPKTGETLADKRTIVNHNLKAQIQDWKAKYDD